MIEVNDIHVYYGDSYILQGVSLHVTEGEITCEFEWRVYTDDSDDFPVESDDLQSARCYVTDSTYWAMNWMHIEDGPDAWEVDRMQANQPVSARFLAVFDCYGGTSQGYIKNPAGTDVWPES